MKNHSTFKSKRKLEALNSESQSYTSIFYTKSNDNQNSLEYHKSNAWLWLQCMQLLVYCFSKNRNPESSVHCQHILEIKHYRGGCTSFLLASETNSASSTHFAPIYNPAASSAFILGSSTTYTLTSVKLFEWQSPKQISRKLDRWCYKW